MSTTVLPKRYTPRLRESERERFKRIVDAIDDGIEKRSPRDTARLLRLVARFYGYRVVRGNIIVEHQKPDGADWWKE